MTNDDLEAIVHEGLSGVCLAKTGEADNVKRLDWKLEELERRRGLKVGSIAIQLLIETAKGMINAYPSATASKRVNSLIFGAVDYYEGHAGETDLRRKRAALRPLLYRRGRPRRRLRRHRLPLRRFQEHRGLRGERSCRAARWAMKAGC